ncbi:hypothetical protein P3X46_005546 [Hevea brasiliensis]|uniref:DUF4378 domain-containing protein n=1 Tax=Hevea brasiliensis TaxID=3981 RepID=A0ABQ9N0W2_HEVBR|nr:uncharacterized protein LOC110639336 isoform X2 [Hevea brasiliensis]XP_058000554.1 uncharacterized protein LOC110639336 isoform X2 [Hevea brasiliensis]KAJ9185981.1 hypothetical protein P3X46_005546 [Hevea brasiliensis]
MEGERKRSKGIFFHFFDWNGKSRKKLFVNNSELSEGSKQGKENVENIEKAQLHAIEADDRRANSSNKGSTDFSCTSSVTSDEGYGTRAPGVVARLMGLESLPTSNAAEPSSTPFCDSASLRASQYDSSTPNLWSEYNPMDYLNNSKDSWNSLESRSLKVQNRPIERFQTEILPPKSAKSIPITHHKLLSPIKTPGFIPTMNVAYIMEAAEKIIEASPKASINGKVPSIGTSSLPLRIQGLKQKMEAAHRASRPQRPNELFSAENTKGQHSGSSQRGSEGKPSCSTSMFSEKGASGSLKNKGKPVSLSVKAKSNVQRREGSTSRNNNIKQKEQKEIRSNQSLKSLPSTQKTKRTSEERTSNVFRQNNQKQNCVSGKESSTSKNSFSKQPGRKAQSMSGSVGVSRTVKKVVLKPETVSRKVRSVVTTSEKDKPNNISQTKQSVNGDFQIDRSVSDNVSCNRDERSIKCNVAVDGSMHTAVDNRKNGMEVISFTFTSPVRRTTSNTQPSMMEGTNSSAIDSLGSNDCPYFQNSTSSFLGFSSGDALGVLLEQKLRELTNKVESSHCNIIRDETSASSTSSLQNFMSTFNVVSTIPAVHDKRIQFVEKDKSDHPDNFDCFSVECPKLTKNQMWQESEEIEEHSCSSNCSFTEIDLECRHPSPVSILEPTFESGSCSNTNVQSDEALNDFSANESFEVEGERELSDSASSISTVDMRRKLTKTFTSAEFKGSSDWELDYVRDVLNNAEIMLKDFTLGHTPNVITPHLFHLLENQENGIKRNEEEYSKLGRKVLFDCVSERLELMCRKALVGSCKSWARMWTLFQMRGWLAEELYKDISGWKSMGDLMVDELVDKDMSTQYGRWLDFNIEAFEEGVEIEKGILTSLVDELVSDLFIM